MVAILRCQNNTKERQPFYRLDCCRSPDITSKLPKSLQSSKSSGTYVSLSRLTRACVRECQPRKADVRVRKCQPRKADVRVRECQPRKADVRVRECQPRKADVQADVPLFADSIENRVRTNQEIFPNHSQRRVRFTKKLIPCELSILVLVCDNRSDPGLACEVHLPSRANRAGRIGTWNSMLPNLLAITCSNTGCDPQSRYAKNLAVGNNGR